MDGKQGFCECSARHVDGRRGILLTMARKRRRTQAGDGGTISIPGVEPVEVPVPPIVIEKVRQFAEHAETYESSNYSEAQLRIDFLNPLLEALGWDVNNKNGYAEAYREVVYEDALKVGGSSKAPDYGFYIGGRAAGGGRKFFLEAKKPSVAIRVDPKPAFQLRRYAYTAGLPLSILTNFKEFLVFDTRIQARPKESASAGLIMRVPYTEFPTRWGEIAGIFARESILKGSFDKYAQAKRKKGLVPIGDSFLADIEEWREAIAKDIAAGNPEIEVDELNFAVQRTIDRILFLRICEDRGIEPTANLLSVTNGERIYERLGQVFLGADDRYNSGIFHFPPVGKKADPDRTEPPDDLTLSLSISDKPLRKIIRSLYDIEGQETLYEFSVMPPEILGQVYEQFLGKVISLTPSHRVKIEEKPEVRKAGGVYYTPSYIVDYIVQETVGKLLEGKTPKDAAKLRVLDPASGSGSFLIGAYQFLLDWHLRWYLENDPDSHLKGRTPALVRVHSPSFAEERDAGPRGREGVYDYRLSTAKRKEILLNSIYGVDIDAQAVEVTKLSLLLKVLEGESQESVNAQLKMFHQRALPDLGKNIKCGNSLISDDFDDSELPDDDRAKINAFNWEREFPVIVKAGGFDAVIGNPPYVRIQTTVGKETAYFGEHYKTAVGNFDIYCLFVERSLELLNAKGAFGFIIPHRWHKTDYGEGLRLLLSQSKADRVIVDFDGFMVFDNASINTCILIIDQRGSGTSEYMRVKTPSVPLSALRASLDSGSNGVIDRGEVDLRLLASTEPWVFVWPHEMTLWERLNKVPTTLADFATDVFQGLKTGADSVFVGRLIGQSSGLTRFQSQVDKRIYDLESDLVFPLAKGGQMRRYDLRPPVHCIIFPYHDGSLAKWTEMVRRYPKIAKYLLQNRKTLESRDRGKMKGAVWYGYSRNQALELVRGPKILVPDYYAHASYCYDTTGETMFCGGGAGGYGIVPNQGVKPQYLLACLNSKLMDWYLQKISMRAYQTAFMYTKKYLVRLPIRDLDCSRKSDKTEHDRLVNLADRMLGLYSDLAKSKSPVEKERLQREIEVTDRRIDELVYELYGLTEEEITIVEDATAARSKES